MKIGKRWLISDVIIADFLATKARNRKGTRSNPFVPLCAFVPLWQKINK